MEVHPNEIYAPVFTTKARYIDIIGGRGRGGSYFITDYALFLITQPKYFRGYFMREVFNDIKESLYRDFRDRVEDNDTVNENDFLFNDSNYSILYRPTGNRIISKGFKKSSGNRTAKLKSIAGATHVFIEEAEETTREDNYKLDDSLRTNKSENVQILRCWNMPAKGHWLLEDFYNLIPSEEYEGYYIAEAKGREDHLSIFSDYHSNIDNINQSTIDLWESYKINNLDHYLTDIKGYVSGGVKGQIFKHWKEYSALPDGEYYRMFGVDWGGNDPNTLIEVNVDKKQKRIFAREWLYEPNILNSDFIKLVKKVNHENDEVVCDSARKDKVREFQSAYINAFGVKKGSNSIIDGIDILKDYEINIYKDSENLRMELESYKWAINPDTKEPMNKPEDKFNHLLDALRYTMMYYHKNYSWTYDNN